MCMPWLGSIFFDSDAGVDHLPRTAVSAACGAPRHRRVDGTGATGVLVERRRTRGSEGVDSLGLAQK